MTSLLVVSDSHVHNATLQGIFQAHPDISICLHCGDIQDDPASLKIETLYLVQGNTDVPTMPKELIIEIDHYQILIVHGHEQVVVLRLVDGVQLVADDVKHLPFAQLVRLPVDVYADMAAHHVDQLRLRVPVQLVRAQALDKYLHGDGIVEEDLFKVLTQRQNAPSILLAFCGWV